MREGDAGDDFHVIADGSAAVTVRGVPRTVLGAGDCFGEIALLRDSPRTATVVAAQPLRTLALNRQAFLTAVTANGTSEAAAETLAAGRLAGDPPGDKPAPGSG
jgi:CRP-like cAMP-binding protein